ncbi:imidazolonepropionase [Moheibacter sediminis]|uniref:Imidazolonepropionase n=1 Tax=Moheibacter sediminis TaxID=1434700 RepID=A0A1W1Y7G7_9FLAO|nr:imidazolonepropionase [Moheibacter sediminis]SMC32103.1 imidazolonepropionase [Moheibacter sediminis]
MKLIGPFSQIITLAGIPLKGAVKDEQLQIIENGGVLIENKIIKKAGDFNSLKNEFQNADIELIEGNNVLLPGFVDSHTHICFGGNRSKDFAMRLNGKTYLEIAESGGGIWSTVTNTRKESKENLVKSTLEKANISLQKGITTTEIKSGYGLSIEDEIKMLEAINEVKSISKADIISTFLGAHMKPRDFEGTNSEYLELLVNEIFPVLKEKNLAKRVDIFTEKSAFSVEESRIYLQKAKEQGFEITIHADQFTPGGSLLSVEFGALSADHLEFSGEEEIKFLAKSDVVATALPGASIGLGMQYTPARKLLDAGVCLSIASDWNPGSAPMGDLVTQASILATFEKLSMAEILSGITFRAAKALNLSDRGILETGKKADFVSFPTNDFRDIIYYQGQMKPNSVWKNGKNIG